jgi:catechol-2,3-dioxygenase
VLRFGDLQRLVGAGITTRDLDRLSDYYVSVLGLAETERTTTHAYLTTGLDHHVITLQDGPDDALSYIAFELSPEITLSEAAQQLDSTGVRTERRSDAEPGIPDCLEFDDPEGNRVRLIDKIARTGRTAPPNTGVGPNKLGHVCVRAVDVPKLCSWYEEQLGFRWSDWIADFFVFVRCGPDHHTLNLLKGERSGNVLHHIAFELEDGAHIHRACDLLAEHGYSLIWGPGRHGPGHNIFTYHRDPDGNTVELFTELDVMIEEDGAFAPRPWHEDTPQRPKRWTPDPLAPNRWGIGPPANFM